MWKPESAPGEKLEEELSSPDEHFVPTLVQGLLSADACATYSGEEKKQLLDRLKAAADNGEYLVIRSLLGTAGNRYTYRMWD